jgi:hypothetical protein
MKYKLYLPNYQNYSTDSYVKYELPKLICLEKYSNKEYPTIFPWQKTSIVNTSNPEL